MVCDKNLFLIALDNGEELSAEILFSLIDPKGDEYIAYYFDGVNIGLVKKGLFSWKVSPIFDDHPIVENVCDIIDEYNNGSQKVKCRGESYRICIRNGKTHYARMKRGIASRERFTPWVDRQRVGTWLVAVIVAVCLYFMISQVVMRLGDSEKPDSIALSYQAAKERMPSEEEYLWTLSQYFSDEAWNGMDASVKLETLQLLCDWELVEILGCGTAQLEYGDIEWGALAYYDHSKNAIVIATQVLEYYPWDIVANSVIHECRHVWQYHMVVLLNAVEHTYLSNLRIFDDVRDYREALTSYVTAKESFEGYYNQAVEVDSRQWAGRRMEEYYLPKLGVEKLIETEPSAQ